MTGGSERVRGCGLLLVEVTGLNYELEQIRH